MHFSVRNKASSKSRPHDLSLSHGRPDIYNNTRSQRNSASASLYSRQFIDSESSVNPVSRSISMGSLNDLDDGGHGSSKLKVHRVPSIQTLNKMNAMKKPESDSGKSDRHSFPVSKSSSNTNLNKKPNERRRSANSTFDLRKAVFERVENADKGYQRSRSTARSRTTGGNTAERARANSANRLTKSDSKNSIASSKSNLSSRSSSERDLSKIARDVTERLSPSTTVTVAKTKHETYTKRNSMSMTTRKSVTSSVTVSAGQPNAKELEKSPHDLPVKDMGLTGYRAITQDVYTAPCK